MLYRRFGTRNEIILIPEDSIDLWALRRTIKKGDLVEAWTSREIKQEGDFIRPDKGKRIKVRIRLSVEHLNFDNELGRLRIRGVIVGSNDESVGNGARHSIEVIPSTELVLFRELTSVENQIIFRRSLLKSFLIIAIDAREAGLGLLRGLSFTYLGTVRSEISGKQFRQDFDKHMSHYMNRINDLLLRTSERYPDCELIILGPGQTKNQLANGLSKMGKRVKIVEGFDTAGEDGVKIAVNDNRLMSIFKGTEYEQAQSILEEVKIRLGKNDNRLAIGFSSCKVATKAKAVEDILLADELFKIVHEEEIVQLANEVENLGGKVILVDSSTLLGVQIGRMGGAVALLRFSLNY